MIRGPAFYISRGLKNPLAKPLAAFFALAIIFVLGFMGNMVQANSISDGFSGAFGIPKWVSGASLALICYIIFFDSPVSCSAGVVVLRQLLAPGFLEAVRDTGSYFMAELQGLAGKFPQFASGARGRGLWNSF